MVSQLVARFLALVTLVTAGAVSGQTVSTVKFERHNILLTLDITSHVALVQDSGTVQVNKGWNLFFVNKSAELRALAIAGKPMASIAVLPGDTAILPTELRGHLPALEQKEGTKLVLFNAPVSGSVSFKTTLRETFNESVENVQFSRETVGNELTGTIVEQGAYLSPSAYYYPQGEETLAQYKLTADIPDTWESVADGNPVSSELKAGRKIQTWENPFAADGCTFMAAPYVIRTMPAGGAEVAAYFFEADTGLAQSYLAASAKYIAMYSEMIGPYPFKRFTVAENFFPTGYGMPGWTLLGQTVLRLPFIITTSLGHEVLHNWWGNSVYVDYARGNWCEAATTYGADYHYKLLESEAAAKGYRKDILKEYISYVSKDKDFPIREFKSRSSANTRAIGYNKAMMVFHLIEQEIGTQAFFDAWKFVYKTYLGKQISWEEWIKAFEQTSGKNLSYIIPEWIDRPGAPVLGMEVRPGSDKTVEMKLTEQKDTIYTLAVPVRVVGTEASQDTSVLLNAAETDVKLAIPAGAKEIAVDPDYHIFRRLYPEEVEPIISGVMGVDKKAFVTYTPDSAGKVAFQSFASSIAEDSASLIGPNEVSDLDHNIALVLLNPTQLPEYIQQQVHIASDSIALAGSTFARARHTFVLSGQNWQGFGKYLVVLSDDFQNLPRLGQLIPHYGKYSYLVFDGAKNVAKGQWEVTQSPLKLSVQVQ